ncbi:methyltransferase [Desulfoluna spongiiphila]|uniref:Ubiquinone/menaquinone biosynthesis C-methylase UbiE n=1 Tax=Desulfoluna spongiiphila TaxID=419481 RepID=A0A1G5AFD8_9BACT|nr:methyltransferase [Desulfoluna spongiiphila]SCX76579.1 Ubiquinone/menaquinone biosynthesis C-methylase UbiE [Desulfoluna spongiiphila]
MSEDQWNPGSLMEASGAYWKSCTIHTGVKLGIFTLLGGEALTAREIADRIHGNPRGLGILLNALSAMDLLAKNGETFSNPPFALKYLTRESPDYIGHILMHHHHLVSSWERLDEAALAGAPVRHEQKDRGKEEQESFLLGMYNNASLSAPDVADAVDLSGCATLLDLGGGPGTYAIQFCKKNPQLRAWVYDLAGTEPFAVSIIDKHLMGDRVGFVPFDFISHSFTDADRFDAAWLSHILHGESEAQARSVIAKASATLHPGGKLLIHEFILEDTKDSPLFPALFSLNMLAVTDHGRAYSYSELGTMMEQSGLTAIRRIDYGSPKGTAVIEGIKA